MVGPEVMACRRVRCAASVSLVGGARRCSLCADGADRDLAADPFVKQPIKQPIKQS